MVTKTRSEEIQDILHNGCWASELDHIGAIFGVLVEEREKFDPLIHFFIEDDEWFTHAFSIDKYWLVDLINISTTTSHFLENKNG